MSLVSDLEARLEQLSSSISRQREILIGLEKAKSDTQGQLNAILDPMALLPLEISSQIFVRCLPPESRLDARHTPMLLLNVCRAWTHIALSTPSLWATIRVVGPRVSAFRELFSAWLERSRTFPLSISLVGNPGQGVYAAVEQHAPRIQTFELYLPAGGQLAHVKGPFPCLTTLTIGGHGYSDSLDVLECMALMRLAPNLVDLTFDNIYFLDVDVYDFVEPLRLPHLQHLRLGKSDRLGEPLASAAILQYLTLPALQSLYMTDFDFDFDDDFFHFFHRSSPPLNSLRMRMPHEAWSLQITAMYFQLIPSLTDLDLTCPDAGDLPLFELLATANDFLPNLLNVTIRGFFSIQRWYYENLINE
ncbi:hypothetical protein C8R43DRAFT_976969 [Mycena crocata]|nr:hypothetical protein C8R43DRAFT_976969 [Mycena crocata]